MPYPAGFHEVAKRVNNWGRWGPDDELGTLNLLSAEVVKAAAAEVRTGKRFSLAMKLSADGPQVGYVEGRVNPERTMVAINHSMFEDPTVFCTSDDVVTMGLQAATHWDSLAHASYDNRIYNGFGADTITEAGAARCGIDKVSSIVGRGVLLDVQRAVAFDASESSYCVTPEDLDAALAMARVEVRPGDLLMIRTGHMRAFTDPARGRKVYSGAVSPGLSMHCAEWFHERDIAAVATDNMTFEIFPPESMDTWFPLHCLDLVEMGMLQGQNWVLEELADDCAVDGIYTCLLSASPEPFVNGLGSPVNPVAIK